MAGDPAQFRKEIPIVDDKGRPERHFNAAFEQTAGQAAAAVIEASTILANHLVLGAGDKEIKTVALSDGQIPIGQTSDGTVQAATLMQGPGVTITNGPHSITISATGLGGTVTSVAIMMPPEFVVAGSPITTAGTLAITKQTESANQVWAGPTTGAAAQPTFRALVAADLPSSGVSLGTYGSATNVGQFTVDAEGRITAAANVAITGGSTTGGSTLLGLERLLGDGSTTTFNLPDLAEYVVDVSDAGSTVDPSLYTLSSDLSQITFGTAPTAGHVLTFEYVVAQLAA